MARNRRRKGRTLRRLLLVAVVALALYIAAHAKAYLDDQRTLQHYVDTHTSAPTPAGR